MRGIASGWGITALGAMCMLGVPTSALAQATKAGVVTTLQGTATVARATAPLPMPLKFRDDVFVQDNIVTGESSIVRILLGGKAVVTVRERSALTIHETPTTSTIEISSGKIAIAVAKDRMKPGESVQIKTPNAMAGVRGTVVIADVAEPAQVGGSVTTRFTLMTGIVDVTQLDARTGQPTGQPVMLHPLQTIAVTGHTPPGAARVISRAEAQKISSDYKASLPAPPPPANTEVTERQIEQAVQHAAALLGRVTTGDAKAQAKSGDESVAGDDGKGGGLAKVGIAVSVGGTAGGGGGISGSGGGGISGSGDGGISGSGGGGISGSGGGGISGSGGGGISGGGGGGISGGGRGGISGSGGGGISGGGGGLIGIVTGTVKKIERR